MFTNRVFRWAVLAVLVLGCALVVRVLAEEADNEPPKREPLVLRMYDVTDLLVARRDYPWPGMSLPVIQISPHPALPSSIEFRQVSPWGPTPGLDEPREPAPSLDEITAIVQRSINVQSDAGVAAWSDEGGPASIGRLSFVLVITQTPAAHKKIEDLLNGYRKLVHGVPLVTIQAKWVQVDADKAEKLLAGGAAAPVLSPGALSQAGAKTVHQGHVRCFDCQTVHLLSGKYQAYLAGVTPVVAQGSLGCDTYASAVLSGAALQVKPVLIPNEESVTLSVASYVGEVEEIRTRPLPELGQVTGNAGAVKVDLDLPSLFVHTFATTIKVPLGKPVLIGGMTQPGAEKGKVLCLVLEVTAAK